MSTPCYCLLVDVPELYPLLFAPVFKARVWGGRRLEAWFPDLPEGPIGEAWILSDHPQGRTPVSNGPLRGETLESLGARFGERLLGAAAARSPGAERTPGATGAGPASGDGGFPLLFKLIDASADLSVQVHPGDGDPGLPPGERGKDEMWVVLGADPGARVVHGLQAGVDAAAFRRAVTEGRTMGALRQVEVRTGDVLHVPPGTVHALGAGLVVAEIQQSSDVVYRVHDYGRPGLDGRPRELHVEEALRVARLAPAPEVSHPVPAATNRWLEVCRTPHFAVSLARCDGRWRQGAARLSFEALIAVRGSGSLLWSGGRESLPAGRAALIPAAVGDYALDGSFDVLRTRLP